MRKRIYRNMHTIGVLKEKNGKHRLGFTLIELLVTIVILGILTAAALPSVKSLIKNNNRKKYSTYSKSLENSAKLYTDSYAIDMFGHESSGCYKLTFDQMESKNILNDIKIKGDTCKSPKTYVKIIKSNNTYKYQTSVYCQNENGKKAYEEKQEDEIACTETGPDLAPPQIVITNPEKVVGQEELNFRIEINDDYRLLENQQVKYAIVKKGQNPKGADVTYNIVNFNNKRDVEKVSKTLKLEKKVDGKFNIYVEPVKVVDLNGNTEYQEVISDDINIDTNPPTCTIERLGTSGENGWYKDKNVNLKLVSPDDDVAAYGLTKSSTVQYNNKLTAEQGNTAGVTWYGFVKDQSGNVGTCNTGNFKVDTTKPTCSVGKSGTTGDNGWYKEKDVTLSLTKNDSDSGLAAYGLVNSSSTNYNSKTSDTQGNTTGKTWYGFVKDKAGNTNSCNSGNIKVDKDKPTCSVSKSGTSGKNGWYVSKVTLSLTKNDGGGSNISSYGLKNSSSETYNSKTSDTQSDTKGTKWYGYVKDTAGNKVSCNTGTSDIKVDTIKPKTPKFKSFKITSGSVTANYNECKNKGGGTEDDYCTINLTGASYQFDSSYTNSDDGSGIDHTEYKWKHNGSATQCNSEWVTECDGWKVNPKKGTDYLNNSIRACDKAGNCGRVFTEYHRFPKVK